MTVQIYSHQKCQDKQYKTESMPERLPCGSDRSIHTEKKEKRKKERKEREGCSQEYKMKRDGFVREG